MITQAWLNAWEHVIPFLAFPPEVRRVIYTTNAIEALNRQLRKAIKTKGHFPNEDAARKLIYLAIANAVPAVDEDAATGRRRCWRSRSTSETASPTLQADRHTFTATGVTVTLNPQPPTQKIGHLQQDTRLVAEQGRVEEPRDAPLVLSGPGGEPTGVAGIRGSPSARSWDRRRAGRRR